MAEHDYCLHCGMKKHRPGGCGECGPDAPGIQVAPHPHYLPPGTALNHGQYMVGRVLGAGGFGLPVGGVEVEDMNKAQGFGIVGSLDLIGKMPRRSRVLRFWGRDFRSALGQQGFAGEMSIRKGNAGAVPIQDWFLLSMELPGSRRP